MRTGIIACAAIAVIAVALFGVLDALVFQVSCTPRGTFPVGKATSIASTVTFTTAIRTQRVSTQTERIYNINPNSIHQLDHVPGGYINQAVVLIGAYRYIYQDVAIASGTDVQVTWRANDTLDVYVFNSSQNSAFAGSNATTTSPNIASSPNSEAGSLSFRVPANDTYYLIFFNPRNGSVSEGSRPVQLDNATGTATLRVTTTTTVIQTTSSVIPVPQQGASTRTATGSHLRTANSLSQTVGTGCPS